MATIETRLQINAPVEIVFNLARSIDLHTISTEATNEKEFNEIQTEYESLRTKLLNSKKNDLRIHRDEIQQILENEIASRYYFEKGRNENSFKYDKELASAVKTMQDKQQLTAILKGDGAYKVIGKPILAMTGKKTDDKD